MIYWICGGVVILILFFSYCLCQAAAWADDKAGTR